MVRANTRDPPDTQWMIDWMTGLQTIRPLRDTNRLVKQLETHEAAPQSPMLVAYRNPQKVQFAVFSYSLDQLKYQDAKTAWHCIFQPANHAAPEEEPKRGERSANGQLTRQKRPKATGVEPKLGSRHGIKTRKLDDQKVLESGDTGQTQRESGRLGKDEEAEGGRNN